MLRTLLVSFALLASGFSVSAQTTVAPEAKTVPVVKKKKPPHSSFADAKDVIGLPRVLLIGDSISMGYTLTVRGALEGQANVHRPKANCGPTDTGLKYLDKWLGDGKWDVIHFNWGLHDVMHYLNSIAREDRVPYATEGAFRRNSPEQYEKNLGALVAKLQATGATLVWASTTPIPNSSTGIWKPGDSAVYNKSAAKVMKENDIAIDDLWAFAEPNLDKFQKKGDVHFSSEGSAVLGAEVARVIKQVLKERQTK